MWLLLARTNQRERPTVMRMYWGVSTIVSGMAAIAALIGIVVAALEDDLERDYGQSIMGVGLVYLPAWIVQLLRLARGGAGAGARPPAASSGDEPTVA